MDGTRRRLEERKEWEGEKGRKGECTVGKWKSREKRGDWGTKGEKGKREDVTKTHPFRLQYSEVPICKQKLKH